MTVQQMLANMTSTELTEWIAFDQVEPFGEKMAAWRAGLITSAIYNAARTKDDQQVFQPDDFMPSVEREEPDEQDRAAMLLAKAKMINAMMTR